uniref:Uncharacterized protein n=1 Tax=Dulem virus 36 TaxID=3145754 RepID=A0AAU8B134_9CAUD
MSRLKFKQIECGMIKESREVVTSETFNENNELIGYSVTERITVQEGENEYPTKIYLKNGLGILTLDGLKSLRTVVENTIKKIEGETK